LSSVDQRAWRGAAAVRILRWPQPAPDAPLDERLLGYMALGEGNALIAKPDAASWRAAIVPLRQAAAHFEAANDMQALAEAEYQRGYIEFNLLYEFEDGSRSAESSQSHFAAAGDSAGAARAAVLRALNEFNIAATMGAEVPRAEQRAMLDTAVARVKRSQAFFDANEMHSDAMNAMNVICIREIVLGEYERTFRCITRSALARKPVATSSSKCVRLRTLRPSPSSRETRRNPWRCSTRCCRSSSATATRTCTQHS
jgi:hypothetical protein